MTKEKNNIRIISSVILIKVQVYFRKCKKSSGWPDILFSPAVCSTRFCTWCVATGPIHWFESAKYEQIFLGLLLALLCSLQHNPLAMLQSLLVRQSSPKPAFPSATGWQTLILPFSDEQTYPDSQSESLIQASPAFLPQMGKHRPVNSLSSMQTWSSQQCSLAVHFLPEQVASAASSASNSSSTKLGCLSLEDPKPPPWPPV